MKSCDHDGGQWYWPRELSTDNSELISRSKSLLHLAQSTLPGVRVIDAETSTFLAP